MSTVTVGMCQDKFPELPSVYAQLMKTNKKITVDRRNAYDLAGLFQASSDLSCHHQTSVGLAACPK